MRFFNLKEGLGALLFGPPRRAPYLITESKGVSNINRVEVDIVLVVVVHMVAFAIVVVKQIW